MATIDVTRIAAFADIAISEAQVEVACLAEERAALRRVATLVAQGMPSDALFSAVCDEVEALAGADASAVLRFDADGTVTVMGAHAVGHPVGARLEPDPDYVVGEVQRTGRAARFDTDDPAAPGMPEVVRAERVRSGLASPIVVEGELWGGGVPRIDHRQCSSLDRPDKRASATFGPTYGPIGRRLGTTHDRVGHALSMLQRRLRYRARRRAARPCARTTTMPLCRHTEQRPRRNLAACGRVIRGQGRS